ncbi:reverse transcriptase domain-containing protein [Candidatus Phytoplasma solani]|uniref:reverse transcriptase domain-containing protein n=1 Tax=Candidatus Phytoplasma solani TaxID=69896 RepID=UPI0032DA04D0
MGRWKSKINPEYSQKSRLMAKEKKVNGTTDKYQEFKKQLKEVCINSKKPTRLEYIRYADDFIIGISSDNITLAYKVMDTIKNYLQEELKLVVSTEKSTISKSKKGVEFLGYDLSVNPIEN